MVWFGVVQCLVLVGLSSLPFLPGLSREYLFDDVPAILQNKVPTHWVFYKELHRETFLKMNELTQF